MAYRLYETKVKPPVRLALAYKMDEIEVRIEAPEPVIEIAIHRHIIALQESEARTAYNVSHCIFYLFGSEAIKGDLRCNNIPESRLTVCHITYRPDVEHTVMSEPRLSILVIERVAVRSLYAAVSSPTKVHDTRLTVWHFLDLSQKTRNRKAFIAHGRRTEPAPVMVSPKHCLNYLI